MTKRTCEVVGDDGVRCGLPMVALGMCRKHYDESRRPPRTRKPGVSYYAAHAQMVKLYGRASSHPCIICERPAEQWAYLHTAGSKEMTGLRGMAYSMDPADYAPLCRKCHSRADNKHFPGNTREEKNKALKKRSPELDF